MPLSIHVFKDARIAYLPNTFTGHVAGLNRAGHGFDHHHSILEALKHCTNCNIARHGRRIYVDLKNAGINVYVTGETEIDKAINLYIKGELVDDPNRPCSHSGECKDK